MDESINWIIVHFIQIFAGNREELINEWINQSIDEWIDQPIHQPIMNWSINQSIDQLHISMKSLQATEESQVALAVRTHRTLELAGDNFYVITCGRRWIFGGNNYGALGLSDFELMFSSDDAYVIICPLYC